MPTASRSMRPEHQSPTPDNSSTKKTSLRDHSLSLKSNRPISRGLFLKLVGGSTAALAVSPAALLPAGATAIRKAVPSTLELLPVIGMGSSRTFNVSSDSPAAPQRVDVLKTFFRNGGRLIDSSPMYGLAESMIGYGLERLGRDVDLVAATKVWTRGKNRGIRQMEKSRQLWGVPRFDIMQIHNMLDWETHVETLRQWKSEGRIRYIGITTSHGRRHEDLEAALLREPFDFVQLTYNIVEREAEARLLPVAAERGLGVIINRPFKRGGLFSMVAGKALPEWAGEIDVRNWAQFFLKFIVSHPAVTCAIPATTRVDHMVENMGAGYGQLPDAAMRRRMVQVFQSL